MASNPVRASRGSVGASQGLSVACGELVLAWAIPRRERGAAFRPLHPTIASKVGNNSTTLHVPKVKRHKCRVPEIGAHAPNHSLTFAANIGVPLAWNASSPQ